MGQENQNRQQIFDSIKDFCEITHGSSNFSKDTFYVRGELETEFIPLEALSKKFEFVKGPEDLVKLGFVYSSYITSDSHEFASWFEKQFGKKFPMRRARQTHVLYYPHQQIIFSSLDQVFKSYQALRQELILINSKNLPVQLGEWYGKCIFGLDQVKSSSQKGFDFSLNGHRVEVKAHWSEKTSHKGVKIRRSLVELSKFCVIIYVAKNFLIKDICFLDSDFILRKFAGKGHTVFLKDMDVAQYFFSRSSKHHDKVVNADALLQFSSPTFAMKIEESFRKKDS